MIKKINKVVLKLNFVFKIGLIIQVAWMALDLITYGELRPSNVDTMIWIIFMIILYVLIS